MAASSRIFLSQARDWLEPRPEPILPDATEEKMLMENAERGAFWYSAAEVIMYGP